MFGFTVENHVLYQRRVRDQTKDRIRLKLSDLFDTNRIYTSTKKTSILSTNEGSKR